MYQICSSYATIHSESIYDVIITLKHKHVLQILRDIANNERHRQAVSKAVLISTFESR